MDDELRKLLAELRALIDRLRPRLPTGGTVVEGHGGSITAVGTIRH